MDLAIAEFQRHRHIVRCALLLQVGQHGIVQRDGRVRQPPPDRARAIEDDGQRAGLEAFRLLNAVQHHEFFRVAHGVAPDHGAAARLRMQRPDKAGGALQRHALGDKQIAEIAHQRPHGKDAAGMFQQPALGCECQALFRQRAAGGKLINQVRAAMHDADMRPFRVFGEFLCQRGSPLLARCLLWKDCLSLRRNGNLMIRQKAVGRLQKVGLKSASARSLYIGPNWCHMPLGTDSEPFVGMVRLPAAFVIERMPASPKSNIGVSHFGCIT